MTEPNMKGISRIDSGSTHGWFVRGYKNGKTFPKLFSDGQYCSKDAAFDAAQLYRDKLFSELAKVASSPRRRRIAYRDSRNKTGVIGVSLINKKRPDGCYSQVYSVTWRPKPGVQKCTSFSLAKYGKNQAFKLAVAFRRKMLRQIYGPGVFRKIANRRADSVLQQES